MHITRKKFLFLFLRSSGILLFYLSLADFIQSCSWKKKEDPRPVEAEEPVKDIILPSQKIILIFPALGTILKAGETVDIKWEYDKEKYLDLYYTSDAGATWYLIAGHVSSTEMSHAWLVPSVPSSFYRVKIQDSEETSLTGQSKDYFRVKLSVPLDLTLYPSLQSTGGFETIELPYKGSSIVRRKSVTEFQVLSLYCTHNGCLINYNGSTEFNCSCHGSKFDSEGEVLQGPAQLPLNEYECGYVQSDNRLLIVI